MLEATQTRNGASLQGARFPSKQQRRLLFAIVLLLGAVTVVLVKDRDFWFGADETAAVEDEQSVSTPSAPAAASPAPVATPATPAVSKHAPHATKRVKLPAMETNVVAGKARSAAVIPAASPWGPATTAAQRVPVTKPQAEETVDASYPLLAGQMSVQGSVLLQALIAADGAVEDMRVLSGPTILVQAAREAVRQWRFKPYLENGKPVETQARVTVNFTIKVSNNTARYQPVSITSDGAI